MGHDKLRKFAENETFSCLLQPDAREILGDGYFNLKNHPVKGCWNRDFFGGKEAPIVLELGCGKGEYTIDLSRRMPERNYIGVDIKGARLWKGAKFATQNKLSNVAFLRTRIEFITAFFAPGEVSEIWLTFSDPQLKSENARLSSPVFLEKFRQIMGEDGIINLKTDSRFLFEYTKAVCEKNGLEILCSSTDLHGSPRLPQSELYEVRTFYENMFIEQGYKINYLKFSIKHNGPYEYPESFDADYWRSVEGVRRSFGHTSHKNTHNEEA